MSGGCRIWAMGRMYPGKPVLEGTSIRRGHESWKSLIPTRPFCLISRGIRLIDAILNITMIYSTLLTASLVSSVYGHGYLTIPASRTRLGFEVRLTHPCSSRISNYPGRHRHMPRMLNLRARLTLARPRRPPSRPQRTLRLQRPRERRLQPAQRQLGQ